jgi:hypothetical protein
MNVLKEYIQSMLAEVRRDEKFIAKLKGSKRLEPDVPNMGKQVAGEWMSGLEMELGRHLTRGEQRDVMLFVKSRWAGLMKRYGNEVMARQALLQQLDNKFNTLRMGP